jgi:hypothetical protein
MFVLPALTTLISLVFAGQVLNQYRVRGRSHQLGWGLALLFYAVAAFPEVTGSLNGWSTLGYKIYYLFGAILLVPWLALGTSELLFRGRLEIVKSAYRVFVGSITLLGVAAVLLAPLHISHLAGTDVPSNCSMWCSPNSETGYVLANGLAALSAAIGNIVGTFVLLGGALFSVVRAVLDRSRPGAVVNYVLGNLLIFAGALVVASAASLTRLGSYTFFYAGQAAGIAIIFGGFLLIGAASQARARVA